MKKLIILLFLTPLLMASDYTFSNGYYWYNGQAYNRTLVTNPGYWYCGAYYPGTSYYQYTVVPTITTKDTGWRSKLLDIAAQRDKFEGEIRKNAFEQAYFMEAIKGLGLQGNYTWQNYGFNPFSTNGYNFSGQGYSLAPVNATTQYGYSFQSLAHLYGDTNLNQLYQQAAQLAQQSQKLGGEASTNFSALIGQEGTNRAKVAEILAKGQMAQQILNSLSAAPSVQGFSFKITQNGAIEKVEENVDPQVKANLNQQFNTLISTKCASCHSGANKKGGFDIIAYGGLTGQQKQTVWARLTTDDPTKLMPKNPDGGPGTKLTQEELRLFFLN